MSEKLKPCPFCGGEAKVYEIDGVFYAGCFCCKTVPVIAQTCPMTEREEAIAAWNTRAERTCKMKQDGAVFGCSACHVLVLSGKPRYCPNCGAKVVEE